MQVKKWLFLIIGVSAISGCAVHMFPSSEYEPSPMGRSEYEWETVESELLQRAIVKIHNRKTGNVGTGLIVKVIRDRAYILTVADVVKGEPRPIVEFFHDFQDRGRARVIQADEDYDSRFQNLALLMVEDVDMSSKLRYDLDDLLRFDFFTELDRVSVIGFALDGEFVKRTSARLSHVDRYTLDLYLSDEMTLGSLLIKENQIVGMITTTKDEDAHAISAYAFRKFIRFGIELSSKSRLLPSIRSEFERHHPTTGIRSEFERQMDYSTKVDTLMETGRFDEALPLAEQILQSRTKELGKEDLTTLTSMNNLAVIYQKLGRFDNAFPLFIKVFETRQQKLGEKHVKTLISMNNLATVHQMMGKFNEALSLYKKVYRLRKNKLGEKNHSTLISLHNLANIHREMGNFQEAQPLFEKSLTLHTEVLGEKHPDTLNTMNDLVKLYQEQNYLDKALPLAQKSYKLCSEILSYEHHYTLEALENLAIIYAKQGKTDKAISLFELFVNRVEAFRNRGDLSAENRQGIFKQWINGYFQLSQLYLNRIRFNDAFQTAEKTKSRTLLEEITVKLAAQKADLSEDKQQQFREFQTRVIAINERIAQEQRLEERLALEMKKNQVVKEFADFHRTLMQKYPKYAQLNNIIQFVDAKTGASLIPKDALFISYLMQENHVLIFTLDSTGDLQAHDLGEIPELEQTLKTYNELLGKRCTVKDLGGCEGKYALRLDDGSFIIKDEMSRQERRQQIEHIDEISRYLGQRLLKHLKKQLVDKERLIISPDGALASIPFETLILDEKPLIATHHVNYIQSLSVLALLKMREEQYQSIENRGTLLAMGAARYESPGQNIEREKCNKSQRSLQYNLETMLSRNLSDSERYQRAYKALDIAWCNLPGTERELIEIERIFADEQPLIFKHEQATEAKLQELNQKGILTRYRYLHFSAHGYLSVETPALSALVLDQLTKSENTDGFITASEWPSYDLKSDLMVLSACQTGVGKVVHGEGIMGLPYALYVAGNKNTLLTLWSVLDNSTADFMVSFFKKLKQEDMDQIDALTATKREFLNSEKYQRPLYWAPFVLYGI
jgi:CHAT domain-containing protein